jgi:molybdenum cofactor cytidylyltransferase
MTDFADIAVAVLAAGQGRRFGSDKLLFDLNGVALGLHIGQTLASMGFGWRFAVTSENTPIAAHYAALGFAVIANEATENGQAHSLHLAVGAALATPAKALLITLADMPFVSAEHIRRVAATGMLTASSHGSAPMPPAYFPRETWPELLETSGDRGAAALLKSALLIKAEPAMLRDIDTPADLPASK